MQPLVVWQFKFLNLKMERNLIFSILKKKKKIISNLHNEIQVNFGSFLGGEVYYFILKQYILKNVQEPIEILDL